ncbi:MAG: hypothetical protein ACI9YR_001535, partial [Bacteroidia bacterium]
AREEAEQKRPLSRPFFVLLLRKELACKRSSYNRSFSLITFFPSEAC